VSNPENTKVKSLYKALQVLDCFNSGETELGVSEIANKLGIYKSSVHNMLSTYEQFGMVKKDPRTGKYQLGLKILELSHNMQQNNDLRHIAHPFLVDIASRTGETCHLAMRLDNHVIYIDTAQPGNALPARSVFGFTAPLYCTGIGKAILAYMNEDFIRAVMRKGYERFTSTTVSSDEALLEELAQIRARGYAIDRMEHEYGIMCIGMPIFGGEREPIAAISLTGPSLRFTEETIPRLAENLQQVVAGVTRNLIK